MTGAVAAMADPPQMAVPTPISIFVFPFSFRSLPARYTVRKAAVRVKAIRTRVCAPALNTLNRFMLKPKRMIEYCSSFFDVYFTPSSKTAGLFQNARSIPNKIPSTGLPIMGTAEPMSHAGTAIMPARAMPGSFFRRVSTAAPVESETIRHGDITIDLIRHEVYKNGKLLDMPLKEFELLKMLLLNKGKVLSRELLLDKIWGFDYYGETRTVDVHIRYIRQKIEDDDSNPIYIETIRGIGYRFNDRESVAADT
jgi:DNA-binding winged helix-turn-helix (wHTH) protein